MGPGADRWNSCGIHSRVVRDMGFFRPAIRQSIHSGRIGAVGVPAGEYFVQAIINRYETFNLKTGHIVKLPPDKWEGQHWNTRK